MTASLFCGVAKHGGVICVCEFKFSILNFEVEFRWEPHPRFPDEAPPQHPGARADQGGFILPSLSGLGLGIHMLLLHTTALNQKVALNRRTR